ncbi:hypothetical protein KBK19_14160 [Microvirga sp. STR05]|uniref:Uncharacterized protein n=1 Tax=Hymenobacter duratus TaxID=2771356 RepID=A0ABR8JH55_9BACT|nr:hypothetical protein [Hymenobacter duratus]MBD2716182.1 hypothetical protein [Hymenobacter duratus]MBR7951096.1 hypothetical protein [Microvirga sp. STR05]
MHKKKYNYGWKQVNIRPATKELLDVLCKQLTNGFGELPMATVIDVLIKEKFDQLNNQK